MFSQEELDAAVAGALATIPADKKGALIAKAEFRNGKPGVAISVATKVAENFTVVADLSWNPDEELSVGAEVRYVW